VRKDIFSRGIYYLLTLKLLQTCMDLFVLLNTKEDILKTVGNQTAVDFHICPLYYRSQWGSLTVMLAIFFKISSFVFSRRNQFIQVWNNLRLN